MQRRHHLLIVFVAVLFLTLPTTVRAEWAAACHGQIPHGAIAQGYEASGEPLWIARAALSAKGRHAGTHPGKVRPAFNGANIPYGGKEIQASCYEVWVGPARWVAAAGGRIPQGAVVAGQEADGQYLYVARGVIQGGVHIGKVRPGFGAANIPYGGKERKVKTYEVLVQ
jgi:hypothetical protein